MTRMRIALIPYFAVTVMLLLSGCESGSSNGDMERVLLGLLVALVASKLGGEIFVRMGQPAVLGELILGIVVSSLTLFGFRGLEFVGRSPVIASLAELGVILLLFQVGLEADLGATMRVGTSALLVAILGVVAPLFLGWVVAGWLLPDAGLYAHIFIGATLCATSIAITARVLRDLRKAQSAVGRIVLGAAVIDDVLGLIVLAAIQGAISAASSGESLSAWALPLITFKAVAFLIAAPLLARKLAPYLFRFVAKFRGEDLLLVTALALCFGFAYVAHILGLAPIVGAFAAGLSLEESHWRRFRERGEQSLDGLLAPLVGFLAPVFFFRMGAGVALGEMADASAWALAGALLLAAVLGKLVCGLGAIGKKIDRLSIGIGMMPRGEVGLIFVAIGAQLAIDGHRVIEPSVFSALVIVIILTTVVTPPLLRWSLLRDQRTERQQ